MRRIIYIHQQLGWPNFTWEQDKLLVTLADLRYRQGKLLGRISSMGFSLQADANFETLAADVVKSSEIEGEHLDREEVRSSVARRLGLDKGGLVPVGRNIEGVVEMMLDASANAASMLTAERLIGWQASLFPSGYSGQQKVVTGSWRQNSENDPMQVISGALGKEKIHFEAPASHLLNAEMRSFLNWFNSKELIDPVIKAAIAHLWFVTIHPFDDGNGRIARAIADLQLCRADGTTQRFYSMSSQIRKERSAYYDILEKTQQGTLDITKWLQWFLNCLHSAIAASEEHLNGVLQKASFWELHAKTIFNTRQLLVINKLLDGFEGKLNTSKWARLCKCSADTALRDLQDLIDKNVLEKEEAGGRSTAYRLCPVQRN